MLNLTAPPKLVVLLGRRQDTGDISHVHLAIAKDDKTAAAAGVDIGTLYFDEETLELKIRLR